MQRSRFGRTIIGAFLVVCLTLSSIMMYPQGHADAAGSGIISTIAGSNSYSYSGDGGPAASATFSLPESVVVDSSGNIYIGDVGNYRVRKIDAVSGIITTVAGAGEAGYSGDGGLATAAKLSSVSGIAIDQAGNLYIADGRNHRIRKVDAASGIITTVVGTGDKGYSGDGGLATAAQVNFPSSVAVDSSGNLFLSDSDSYRIRKVDALSGVITTVAGVGSYGFSGDGGSATAAKIAYSWHIAVDDNGNMYTVESERIRKIDALTGIITTVAGNGTNGYSGDGGPALSAQFKGPRGMTVDSGGNIFFADAYNHRIRRVDAISGIITTVAGNGLEGYSSDNVLAPSSRLNYPYGVAINSNGVMYIADRNNSRIRKVALAVSYNGNSGSGTVPVASEYNKGATVTVSGNTGGLTKSRYVFDGWNTAADGSGTDYAANDTFIMGNESVVLYAKWIANPYSIEAIGNQTMEPISAGYDSNAQETKTITIKKTGTGDLEELRVALSGNGSGDFEISQPARDTLDSAIDSTTFTVKAKDGLEEGTHTALVTVSGKNLDEVRFTVTQVVTKRSLALPPTVDPANGTTLANHSFVTLRTETADAAIYYTTDGTMPTTSSSSGTNVKISGVQGGTVTVKAIAVKDGMSNSATMIATFRISSVLKGDANGDGKVTAADALIVYKYIQNKVTLTEDQLQALDMNEDGKVDALDAELIMKIYTDIK